MLNVYLLRHGETAYNADGNRYCGRTDIGLTSRGLEQAASVAGLIKNVPFAGVYSSPLLRARHTAEIASGKNSVRTDYRLIEADFGLWEGKTREAFVADDPQSWNNWISDPWISAAGTTGETARQIVERVDAFFTEMRKTYAGQTLLVVAHNGVNRLYMAYKLGMELRNYRRIVQENAAITRFQLDDDGEFSLLKLNAV